VEQKEPGTTPEVTIQTCDVIEAKSAAPRKCVYPGCGTEFVGRAHRKFCDTHKRPTSGTPEEKRYEAEAQRRSKKTKKQLKAADAAKPTSGLEVSDKRKKQILEDRGFSGSVLQAMLWLGPGTAEILGVNDNEYFYQHGPSALLKKTQTVEPGFPFGELLDRPTLFALYELCAKGRKIIGQERSFEEWLKLRFKTKTDLWFLCVDVCGKGLVERTHREMIDFFVKKDPTLLPPDYDQDSFNEALRHQDDQHLRMLLFPRGFYKSTCSVLDIVQWILNFPDIRALVVTATLPLAQAFCGELTKYFLLRLHAPTNLNLLFPEFTVTETNETEFHCPMARLGTKEPNVWASAEGAEDTGFHCTLLVYDDFVSQKNSNTPELRDKLETRFNLINELLDQPFGFTQIFGTRYSGDKSSQDLYGRLLEQHNSGELDLKFLIRAAWTVRLSGQGKRLQDLQEEDVDLLFPVLPDGSEAKGSFRILRQKLGNSPQKERNFRQQQLNEAVSDEEDLIKLQFDDDLLHAHIRHPGFFDKNPRYQLIETVQGTDCSRSSTNRADFSAVCTARLYRDHERNKFLLVVADMVMERLRLSELAKAIVDQRQKWSPQRALIEKDGYHEALQTEIDKYAVLRGIPVSHWNFYWKPTQGSNVKKRALRVKALEGLLASDQLWFCLPNPQTTELLLAQFVRFDGLRKSGYADTSKDDGPDVVSSIWEAYGPKEFGEIVPDVQQEIDEQQRVAAHLKAQHDRYFGGYEPSTPGPQYSAPEQPTGGIHGTLGRFGLTRAA
jgi:hypothetical protein